jgi:hemolysin activation/secretion protein
LIWFTTVPTIRNAMLALLAFATCHVYAQQVVPVVPSTSAEEFIRQQERERVLRQQQEATPDVHLPRPETTHTLERLPEQEANCVTIHTITLTGDAADQFQWALADANHLADGTPDPATPRCLGTQGMNLVMKRIQNALIKKGYVLAQVLAGPQSHLNEGRLELTLFPGRIRHIEFAPGTDGRATMWNAMPAQPGDLLNLRDIEQALENFKRVPSAEADIEFKAAEGENAQPGQSDVIVKWKQGFPFRLTLSADDAGSKATGKYQGGVTLSYDDWWTLNDLFYISANNDLGASGTNDGPYGTNGYTAHYSVPFGYWQLGLTVNNSRYYQQVAGVNQPYIYSGDSQNNEIKLSRLVYRDTVRKTTVSFAGWTRASKNYIDDTEIEIQRRQMAGWELGVAHREFIDNAILDASLNYRHGTGAWDSLAAPEEAFDEGTARPVIVTADVQFNTPFKVADQQLSYTGALRAQWNRTPLIPQDRFSIGGRYTVRGFDGESQLLAERGWLLRNEIGLVLGRTGQQLYAGADYGQVGGPSSDSLIGTHLAGAVLGLRGGVKWFFYDVFAGVPLIKPEGFRTAGTTVGFNLNASF